MLEGSAISTQDLIIAHAEKAKAILLLADRFTQEPVQEDLSILFQVGSLAASLSHISHLPMTAPSLHLLPLKQVWACKSYTNSAPLYVQTLRQATVAQIRPFLDHGKDLVVSLEQIRFRMLALAAVCPGASTLLGNLLRSSDVYPHVGQGIHPAPRR